ncbi:DUF4349 domain-containing protein [Virgibacillus oceani]|uniref:DUF4349 domain-containing protein n=1 Tax=Virgibacillus oceani TaxID=1479511 RepID=A0A917M138_9BACI|nr:DUF4349 domain-containing protein [Virgibacillus oceani]GGG72363.1 hypothetical protein GCM10011398_15920 [Virgibacillus oceani]
MKKCFLLICILGLGVLLAACSNQSESSESNDKAALSTEDHAIGDEAEFSAEVEQAESSQNDGSVQQKDTKVDEAADIDRKIIYTANLSIEVKDYQKALDTIQNQATDRGGYIVESNMYEDAEYGSTNGHITVRIPQDQFRDFIALVEKGSSKVLESSVSGQDVTEEFVDLEARLKSKRVVEKRLLSFMEQAEKTEDLLTISEDLANVQEEIEEITGRMKYLQNKTDLATVTIQIQENNVSISGMSKDDLNTWDQIKQQFLKSINFLITALSGLLVFFVGNLPIFILLGVIGIAVLVVIKKRRKGNSSHQD